MTKTVRFLLGAGLVLACAGVAACSIEHHPDATHLQRDLRALPAVVRAEVDYMTNWLEPNAGNEASLWVKVELEPTAAADSVAAALSSTATVLKKHRDWDGSLWVEIGSDSLNAYDLTADFSLESVPSAARLFDALRPLGEVSATLDGAGGMPEIDLDLPAGTTGDDLRPAYARLAAVTQEVSGVATGTRDLRAADGSGIRTEHGVPSSAEWREWRRLSAITLPGADVGIYLRAMGAEDLMITPRAATADLENPTFRDHVTAAVRGEISDYRKRTGFSPSVSVWIDGVPVAYVGPDQCRYGLSSWDDELNEWFWEVDCSTTEALPTDPEELAWRIP